MPLISIWSSNPSAIQQFTIEQIVNAAGDGDLKDHSECSKELRSYLSEVTTSKLADYIERCLTASFTKSGMVLQDLVNELGRRLDYTVTNGLYHGTRNSIGFDGIWRAPEGNSLIIEVKTTDAYRISLDTLAGYREQLLKSSQVTGASSILIIVGRQNTGELEAQIRGSRHAWDIRLISADALIRLVQLKEEVDSSDTGQKIRSLLVPREYTKLDTMIDVMFTTAKEVEGAAEAESDDEQLPVDSERPPKAGPDGSDRSLSRARQAAKRDAIVAALGHREQANLIRKSRTLYWNPSKNVRVACTISKRYVDKAVAPYWYAYHPQWDEFLGEGSRSFVVFGCMDRDEAFAVPVDVMRSSLDGFYTSEPEGRDHYWHIHITESESGEFQLMLPRKKSSVSLTPYRLQFSAAAAA